MNSFFVPFFSSSDEIIIEVANGPVNGETTNTSTNSEKKQVITASNNEFKWIKTDANLASMEQQKFFQSKLFWSLLAGSFMLIPLFVVAGRIREKRLGDVAGNKLRRANALAKKYLGEAKKHSNHHEKFYDSLERALHNYLRAKLSIETSEMSKDHINTLLLEKGANSDTTSSFINLLKSCEFARYAKSQSQSPQNDYDLAAQLLSNLDKQMK